MKYIEKRVNRKSLVKEIVFDFEDKNTRVEGDSLFLKIKESPYKIKVGDKVTFVKNLRYFSDATENKIRQEFEVLSIENDVVEFKNPPINYLNCTGATIYSCYEYEMDKGPVKLFNYLATDFDKNEVYYVLDLDNEHKISDSAHNFSLRLKKPSIWNLNGFEYYNTYDELLIDNETGESRVGKEEQFYVIKQSSNFNEETINTNNAIVKKFSSIEEYESSDKSGWDSSGEKTTYVSIVKKIDGTEFKKWYIWVNGALMDIEIAQNIIKIWKGEGYFYPRTEPYEVLENYRSYTWDKKPALTTLSQSEYLKLIKDDEINDVRADFYKHFDDTIDGKKLQVVLNTEGDDSQFSIWGPYLPGVSSMDVLYNVNGELYDDRVFFKECGNKVILSDDVSSHVVSGHLKFNIPINQTFEQNLFQENVLKQEYVDDVITSAIPDIIDYEKNIVKPFIQRSGQTFVKANRLVFNLHFRDRILSEESKTLTNGWTTSETKLWNGWTDMDDDDLSKSDLLWYLGFEEDDVYFQKMKLQKSFLRLSFYDSNDPMNQNLLFYSTIFLDTGDLFGAYNKLKTKAIDGEIKGYDTESNVMYIDVDGFPRLSSQFIVTDKFDTNKSSEGFYLYLFNKKLPKKEPETIYMKVEFNHAKYGKTIPFLYFVNEDKSPISNKTGVKTSYMETDDNGGYKIDMDSYFNDLFIELEMKYDEKTRGYIYYLPYINDDKNSNDIVFNLFEPRINGDPKATTLNE